MVVPAADPLNAVNGTYRRGVLPRFALLWRLIPRPDCHHQNWDEAPSPLPLFRQSFLLMFARLGPQDMPAGWRPVLITLAAFIVVGVLVAQAADQGGPAADMAEPHSIGAPGNLILTLLDAAILAGYSWLWVSGRNKAARLPQALTALFGVRAALGLVTWPVVAMMPSTIGLAAGDTGPTMWDWLFLVLFFWNLFAMGQIYRHTLDVGPGAGVLVSLGYFVVSTALTFWLAPHLLPATGAVSGAGG